MHAFACFIALLTTFLARPQEQTAPDVPQGPRVVVLTDSRGFVHEVVKPVDGDSLVVTTLRDVVETRMNGTLVHVSDAAELNKTVLDPEKTAAIVMYTTGDIPLDVPLLQTYIENGGALVGIHCATDTLMDTEAFVRLIGGAFDGHPWNANTPVTLKSIDRDHPIAEPVGGRRELREEIYQFRDFDPDAVRTLIVLDMERTALKADRLVPVAWCKQVGQGRVAYTSLGHRDDVWRAGWYQDHLLATLQWATGAVEGPAEPNPREAAREEALAKQAATGTPRQQNNR